MTLRMPAEWTPHERCVMAWPARSSMWGSQFAAAKADYAEVARVIARTEPVLMVANPGAGAEAAAACATPNVDVVEWPIDDSWTRDMGAVIVTDGDRRAGVDFVFNSWGEKFLPYDEDARFAKRMCDALGIERIDASPFVLEGGAITVDGEGTLVTTEQCLLNPNRNPALSRDEIEARAPKVARSRTRSSGSPTASSRTTTPTATSTTSPRSSAPDASSRRRRPTATIPTTNACAATSRCCERRRPRRRRARRAAGARRSTAKRVVVPPLNAYLANGSVVVPGARRRARAPRARDLAGGLPRSRGRRRARRDARVRWRRRPLHHPAGTTMTIRLISNAGHVPESPASPIRRAARAPFRIGVVQERWHPDPAEHEAAIAEGVRVAAGAGAELVCLQELTLSPYFAVTPDGPTAAGAQPEPLPGGRTHEFASDARDRARRARARVALRGRGRRRPRLQHRDRRRARRRARRAPASCTSRSPRATTKTATSGPGDTGYPVVALGDARFGFPTCWDQWFPELARYSLAGADVIVYPTAIGSEPDHPDFDTEPLWEQVIRGNGIANGTFMVAINRIGDEPPLRFYGSSFVSDPYGRVLVQAPRDEPAVLVADLDLDARRDWLALFPFLGTRRPDTYEPLIRTVRTPRSDTGR